jgi:hypothetical protein
MTDHPETTAREVVAVVGVFLLILLILVANVLGIVGGLVYLWHLL